MITYKPTRITINTFKKLDKQANHTRQAMRRGLYTAGKLLTNDLKKSMTARNVSGRKYKVYVGIGGRRLIRGRIHTASRPSELPAIITGAYRKSIDFKVLGSTRMIFGSATFAKAYAKQLEERNKPIKKTADKNDQKVKQTITNLIKW